MKTSIPKRQGISKTKSIEQNTGCSDSIQDPQFHPNVSHAESMQANAYFGSWTQVHQS